MRKAFRHTGVLMMLGVVALGLIGAAYTLWYEDLVLETTIETGTLNADWSLHGWSIAPNGAPIPEGGFSPASSANGVTVNGKPIVAVVHPQILEGGANLGTGGRGQNIALFTNANYPAGKPQTECTGVIGSTANTGGEDANDTADNNKLTLYAGGLFPYAGCEWQIDIKNSGSVPFHIAVQGFTVEVCTAWTGGLDPTCTTWAPSAESPFTRAILGEERNPNSTGDDRSQCWNVLGADWNLRDSLPEIINNADPYANPYTGNIGNPIQLHENEDILCNLALVLDQNPDAEGKTYRYTISWRTFQWNETPNDTLLNANP